MKLVVGLGNPGRKYEGRGTTSAFWCWPSWPDAAGEPRPSARFRAKSVEATIDGERSAAAVAAHVHESQRRQRAGGARFL